MVYPFRQGDYTYKKGTTAVLKQSIKKLDYEIVQESVAMETS